MSPDALHEYLFYKNNAKTGLMLSVIGTALASTAVFTLNRGEGLSNGLIGGACVTLGTSLVFSISGDRHFRKALRYRERDEVVLR
jgi:hypothetical protein